MRQGCLDLRSAELESSRYNFVFSAGISARERLKTDDFCLSTFPPDSCRSVLRRSDRFRSSERPEVMVNAPTDFGRIGMNSCLRPLPYTTSLVSVRIDCFLGQTSKQCDRITPVAVAIPCCFLL